MLGVHLEPVGELAREVIHRDLVAVLVAKLRRGVARLLHDVADVGCRVDGGKGASDWIRVVLAERVPRKRLRWVLGRGFPEGGSSSGGG